MKEELVTVEAPSAVGAYSQGIKVGKTIFSSGQLPIDTNGRVPESAGEQAQQSLMNIGAVLKSAGCNMDSIVKTTVLLQDIKYFEEVDNVYKSYFTAPFPARSCFAVDALPKGVKVEIEVVAICE